MAFTTKLVSILKMAHIYDCIRIVDVQGGMKFEILWEPNFSVTNFSRNNRKQAEAEVVPSSSFVKFKFSKFS